MVKKKIKIEMNVTEPQAIAIHAMFKYWNHLANIGSSRFVSFMVDGDGNFNPHAKIESEWDLKSNEDIEKYAVALEKNGQKKFDFDPVALALKKKRDKICSDTLK